MNKVILFLDKHDCCGCTACKYKCPVGAIEMIADDEGFLYPVINKQRCISCLNCLRICPIKKELQKHEKN